MTLRKHYAEVLATAAVKANSMVAQSLFNKATRGDGASSVSAAIFWLKTLPFVSTMRPFERTRVPGAIASTIVFAVPSAGFCEPAYGEPEPGSVRQPRDDVRGEAIAGHDIEADAGHQHDANGLGARVKIGEVFEDIDFASYVAVVYARRDACLRHRRRGG